MSEILPVVFAVVLVVLTIVLSIVGIQLVLVLVEVRRTMKKLNTTIDLANDKFQAVIAPLQKISNMVSGVQVGAKVFEAFVSWLEKRKQDEK